VSGGTVILVGRTRQDRRLATRSVEDLDAFARPRFLYLCRGQRKARVVRETYWRRPDRSPTFLPEAHTWGSYRQLLYERFADGPPQLSELSRDLLIGRLWRLLQDDTKRWSKLPDSPATRTGLARLLSDWQHSFDGTQPPALGAAPEQLPFAPVGLANARPEAGAERLAPAHRHDLWLLISGWRRLLEASGVWTDAAGASRSLLRSLRQEQLSPALRLHLQRFSSLVVDDLLWLSPLDRAVLDALVDAFARAVPAGQVRLCVETGRLAPEQLSRFMQGDVKDCDGSSASLALRRCWQRRVDDGRASLALADRDPERDDITDILARDGTIDLGGKRPTGAVRLRRYGSELAEVRAIARSLKSAIRGGVRPQDCAVAFPSLERYLPPLRDSFAAYGIPLVIERGEPLLAAPPVSAARQLLGIAATGGDREQLRTLLASGWIRFRTRVSSGEVEAMVAATFGADPQHDSDGEQDMQCLRTALQQRLQQGWRGTAAMDELHRSLVECGAEASQPRSWLQPVVAHQRAKIRRELRRRTGDDAAEIRSRRWRQVARQVLDIYVMQQLVDRIGVLGACTDVRSAAAEFEALMRDLQLEVSEAPLRSPPDPVLAAATAANTAALVRFHELVEEVSVAAAVCAALVPDDDAGPSPIQTLRDALEPAIADSHYRGERPGGGVSVTGIRDLHGIDIPWLWVGGATQGEWPRSAPPSFLLPHGSRGLIESLDPCQEDRALFFSLLRNADHGDSREQAFLCISWPQTVAGGDVAPSPLVQELLALRGHGSTANDLDEHWQQLQQFEEAALPRLLSHQELLVDPLVEKGADVLLDPPLRDRLQLHRSLHQQRSDLRCFGRWDGMLGLDSPHRQATLGWLRELLSGGAAPAQALRFSATAVESFARCPMRFFLSRVLRAEEPMPWSPDPGPPAQGTLVHRALERFFEERIAAAEGGLIGRAGLEGVGEADLAALKVHLRRITYEVANEVLGEQDTPYRREMLRQLTAGLDPSDPENGGFSGRLAAFLDEEAQPFLNLDPVDTEWSFPPFNPAAVAADIDGLPSRSSGDLDICISGTVDRIDADDGAGSGLGGAVRAVYDYKTGAASVLRSVDMGLNMQPVIYAAAASKPHELECTITGYRELPTGGRSGRTRLAGAPRALADLHSEGRVGAGFPRTSLDIDAALWSLLLRRIEWYAQLIGAGVFPTTLAGTREAGCKRCDYRRACRHDSLRAALTGTGDSAVGSFLPRPQSARDALRVLQAAEAGAQAEGASP
jgi:hypothetical protein